VSLMCSITSCATPFSSWASVDSLSGVPFVSAWTVGSCFSPSITNPHLLIFSSVYRKIGQVAQILQPLNLAVFQGQARSTDHHTLINQPRKRNTEWERATIQSRAIGAEHIGHCDACIRVALETQVQARNAGIIQQ